MWPFAKSKKGDVEIKVEELDQALKSSFQKVRDDFEHVNLWLNYFYSQEAERQNLLTNLQHQLTHMPAAQPAEIPEIPELNSALARLKSAEEKIEQLKVSVHSSQPVINKIAELNSKVNLVEQTGKSVFERLREISARVDKLEQNRTRSSINLREKIMKKVARKSKDYIKNVLLSTIGKYDEISALQLREMIVEEQGLCSKSTFYRILEEIEEEESVSMVAKGKEKVYLPKIVREH